MRLIKKKPFTGGMRKDLVYACGRFFRYDCSVLLPRLSLTSVTGFQCCFLICCDVPGTFTSVLNQTDAWWKVFLWKYPTKNFRVNIFSSKKNARNSWSLPETEARPAERSHFLPNNTKTFQRGFDLFRDGESNVSLSLRKTGPLLYVQPQTTDGWRCISQDSLL